MSSAVVRGDWQALVSTLRPFIARRVDAPADVDDVLQETLLRLHRGVGALHDDDRFGPWMYRVARNAVADHRRARTRHPVAHCEAPEVPEVPDEARAFACEIDQHMAALVMMLPEPSQTAVRLTELEGRSQAEVARLLGVPMSTVKSRVQRGRQRLRAMVEALCVVTVDAGGRLVQCEHRTDVACCAPPATDDVTDETKHTRM